MNILVTGANGQLSQCIKWIVELNFNGQRDHYVGEKNCYIFKTKEELPIGDLESVRRTVKQEFISVIINCAAYTDVNSSQVNRELADIVNNVGAMNLAIAAKEVGAVLIHISTDYVFSVKNKINTPLPPYNFSDPFNGGEFIPVDKDDNYYGFSKLNGEDAIIRSGCRYIILRTSWLYSWFGKNFVKTMYSKLLHDKEVNVVYDQVGSPTSAHELAMFIYHIIENHGPNTRYLCKEGIYNFCENGVASWYDIVQQIHLYLEKDYEFENLAEVKKCLSSDFAQPVKRPNYSVLDNTAIKETFDFNINYWTNSLRKVVDHLCWEIIEEGGGSQKLKTAIDELEKELNKLKETQKGFEQEILESLNE